MMHTFTGMVLLKVIWPWYIIMIEANFYKIHYLLCDILRLGRGVLGIGGGGKSVHVTTLQCMNMHMTLQYT